jgi:hypothetical protein
VTTKTLPSATAMIKFPRHIFNVRPAAHGNRYKANVAGAALIYRWLSPPIAVSHSYENNSSKRPKTRLSTNDSRKSFKCLSELHPSTTRKALRELNPREWGSAIAIECVDNVPQVYSCRSNPGLFTMRGSTLRKLDSLGYCSKFVVSTGHPRREIDEFEKLAYASRESLQ